MISEEVSFQSVQQPPITWLDIARTLAQLEPSSDEWISKPASLFRANVDWLCATFEFSIGPIPDREFFDWLDKVFPHRIERSGTVAKFLLERPGNLVEGLAIELEVRGADQKSSSIPLGAIEGIIYFHSMQRRATAGLPVIACHSVKGGNGRTTTALACATEWASRTQKPVLIVDADLEAPGLSYLYRRTRGAVQIALEDVIALAHNDDSGGWSATIEGVASALRGQQIDNIFVLPLRRSLDELASSSVRAEHLATSTEPYALADLMRAIATRLGCAGVIVDLRAGLSPIASQVLLDPSVSRIFVTSLAGQSLDGTVSLFRYLAREARRRDFSLGQTFLVVNRIPSVLRETGADETFLRPTLDQVTYELLKGRRASASENEAIYVSEDDIEPFVVCKIPEISDLQASSTNWQGFMSQMRSSGFIGRLAGDLGEWLVKRSLDRESEASLKPSLNVTTFDFTKRDSQCLVLREFAGKLVAAEIAENPVESPLVTGPLRALAEQFRSSLPIVVAEGAKGSGKTLTSRFLTAQQTWSAAVKALSDGVSNVDALILPVLGSIQASGSYQNEIDEKRVAVASKLGFGRPQTVYETKSYLTSSFEQSKSEKERSAVWMNAIAWSAGLQVADQGAGDGLVRALRAAGHKVLAVVEGVEELYQNPFAENTPAWLRSLIIDLPQRLRNEPSRPLGMLVYARRDSVDAAVPQNTDQFRRLYASFALSWSDSDVLELAAWLATKSGAINVWSSAFRELPQEERERKLFPLWGRKLGPDDRTGKRTAEAYTANWIVAVLSDLQSRLVARDLVRLLENAAAASIGVSDDEFTESRLLTPRALRGAVKPTSVAKVAETQEEIAELRPVFNKFRRLPDQVVAPLDSAAIETLGLRPADIALLQRQGILFGDAPPYEVPELFRMGLNLRHSGARHSVINLRRRARQRLGLPV